MAINKKIIFQAGLIAAVIAVLSGIVYLFAGKVFPPSVAPPSVAPPNDTGLPELGFILEATDEIEEQVLGGEGDFSHLLTEKIILQDKEGNIVKFSRYYDEIYIRYPGAEENEFYLFNSEQVGVDALFLPVWPPAGPGVYIARVTRSDGSIQEADFYWGGTLWVENPVISKITDAGYSVQMSWAGQDLLDLALATRVVHIAPSGEIKQYSGNNKYSNSEFIFEADDLREGEHVILVRMDGGQWYWALLNYPQDF